MKRKKQGWITLGIKVGIVIISFLLLAVLLFSSLAHSSSACSCEEKMVPSDGMLGVTLDCVPHCNYGGLLPAHDSLTFNNCHYNTQHQCVGSCKCYTASVCGNGICEPLEDQYNCVQDCSHLCGNLICDAGETEENCPKDCLIPQNRAMFRVSEERKWVDNNSDRTISKKDDEYTAPDYQISTFNARYDVYGNLLASINPAGVASFTFFDKMHANPVYGFRNGRGTPEDPEWRINYYPNGQIKSEIDENGEKVQYYYNNLGMLEREVDEGDTYEKPTIRKEYHFPTGRGDLYWVKTYSKITNDKYALTIEFFDGFGRIIQKQKLRDDGKYIVSTQKYDSDGRIVSSTKPFVSDTHGGYINKEGKVAERYSYIDFQNTMKKDIIHSDGSRISYYFGATGTKPIAMLSDEEGHTKLYTFDVFGNLLEVKEGSSGNMRLMR